MADSDDRERSNEREALGEIREAAKDVEKAAERIKKASEEIAGAGGYQSSGGDDVIPPTKDDE